MKKYMLSNKIITAILNENGGQSNYTRTDDFIDSMVYNSRTNPGVILSIEWKYDRTTNNSYIESRLTDNHGKIVQTDCYEILFATDLFKKTSQKKGQDIEYIDKKIAYIGPAKQKSRRELEKELKELREQNNRLLNNTEQEFMNSRTYYEMQEKISLLETVLSQRDEEITKLQADLAELRRAQTIKNMISDKDIEHAEKQIEEKRAENHHKRGKKSEVTKEKISLILSLHDKGYSMRDIAGQVNLSVGWVHEMIKRYHNTEQKY